MNYKRGLFSLVAATLLGSSAVADTSAVYLPLSTASHDASWILFGVNGFSSGVPSTRTNGSTSFSSGMTELEDSDATDNYAVEGLDKGFSKSLEINGVGYRAAVKGKVLELQLGFSHPVNFEISDTIEITVDKNIINIKGSSKQEVGQVAAKIRGFRPPEPYKGKGVKYTDEHIVRKAGKTAKK